MAETTETEVNQEDVAMPTFGWLKWLPVVLFFLAFGLRLLGIGWGLPNDLHNQSFHPDEQVIFVQSLRIEPAKSTFTPGFYNYGTLYLTVLRIASDVVAGYGAGPKGDDPQSVWRWMGASHLAGRVISALSGAALAVFVFLILRRFVSPLGAMAGGALIAFSPSLVIHSRFQTVDVFATMLLAASLWFAVRILDDPRPDRCALWAGVFAGLSTGTKYTGALALLALILAIGLRREQVGKGIALGIGAWAIAFVVATPGSLLDSERFLRDLKFEMAHTSTGHGIVFEGVGSGFLYHVTNLFQGLGPLALILAVVGLGWGAVKREKALWALLAFALPYYVLIGRAEVLFVRYTFPLLIVLAVGFGWLVGKGHEKKSWWMLFPAFGVLALGMALQITWGFSRWMVGTDPRDSVARQLKSLPNADSLTIGLVSDPWYYTPALFPSSAVMRGQMAEQFQEMERATPRVVRYLPANRPERIDWDIRLLTETKPDYVVYSNFEVGPVARLSGLPGTFPAVELFKAFHAELEKSYEPAVAMPTGSLSQRYAGTSLVEDMAYVRCQLYIWKRKP